MRVLILGGDGMLGHRTFQLLRSSFNVFVTLRNPVPHKGILSALASVDSAHIKSNVNAFELSSVLKVLGEVQPHIVLNCIGIVKQRDEAKSAIPSIQVNALFPHQLAELCQARGIRLIHLSTDCVFSGERGHYTEDDRPDPVDLYGQTKLLGELDQSGCLTLRTSIIGWELKHQAGLLEWFAAQRRRTIRGYRGAIYTGVSTAVLARLIEDLITHHPDLHGLFHVASQPISKYALLMNLRDALGWHDIVIEPDDAFQCDRSLVGARFEASTGWSAPTWDAMITELAAEWPAYQKWRATD